MQDPLALGEAYFQASLIAERDGHWVLARTYAERAKTQYEELADRSNVGRLLNNLGGLEFLLGKPEQAIDRLQEAFAVALEHGTDDDVATVVSSLAQVCLKTGDPVDGRGARAPRAAAARRARGSRSTRSGTRGSCSGARCSTRTGSTKPSAMLAEAEDALAQLSSGPHRAAAWVAQGDLAQRRGDDRQAAVLYRRAAEALQDFRF